MPYYLEIAEIYALVASPAVHKVNLLQKPCGQVSPKPTTLLVLRLPGLEEALARAVLPVQELPPLIDIMARDADGGWNTAVCKEYPPAFCAALVASILCYLGVPLPLPIAAPLPSDAGPPCLPASTIQLLGNVAPFCQPLSVWPIGPDFAVPDEKTCRRRPRWTVVA